MPFNFFPPSPLTGGHSKEDSTWNWGSNDTKFSLDQFNSRSKLKLTRLKDENTKTYMCKLYIDQQVYWTQFSRLGFF